MITDKKFRNIMEIKEQNIKDIKEENKIEK